MYVRCIIWGDVIFRDIPYDSRRLLSGMEETALCLRDALFDVM